MIQEYLSRRVSSQFKGLVQNPVIPLASLLVFIFYTVPNLQLYFISKSIASYLILGSIVSLVAVIIFQLSKRAIEESRKKSALGKAPYLSGFETPRLLAYTWGCSMAITFFSVFFAISADIFTISYGILNFIFPGNEKLFAPLSLIASVIAAWAVFKSVVSYTSLKKK